MRNVAYLGLSALALALLMLLFLNSRQNALRDAQAQGAIRALAEFHANDDIRAQLRDEYLKSLERFGEEHSSNAYILRFVREYKDAIGEVDKN